ncbi:MAG: hypothetical protein ACREFB_03070 [Stellaceae bacterium]
MSLASRLSLPFGWDALDQAPTAKARATAEWSNAGTVRFLLHEIDLGAAVRPAEERLVEALAPIHARLDMIIEMLGRLSYRDIEVPPRCAVELSLVRIGWQSPAALPIDGWVRCKLYFHPVFLEPVVLYGRVAFCGPADPRTGCEVQADLDEMPPATGEALVRLAFLTQRRQLGEQPGLHSARTTP